MAKKRTTARKRAVKSTPIWRRIAGVLVKLSLVLLVLAGLGLIYLDAQVRAQFEGKRWELPAKVYARPLELYPQSPLTIAELKIELKGLGYQAVNKVSQPGEVEYAKRRVRVYTRGFDFPDGAEAAQVLLLEFDGNGVRRITDQQGQAQHLVRLEPVLIGGIYPTNNEDRDLIRLEQAPAQLKAALIAIEDQHYYQHFGLSMRGIARAMWVNLRAGRFVQGGSTLTQQLIKNFYLTSERTLARKLLEMPMAVLLEWHYSKEEILEAYLNEVYLGQEGARAIHGFGLASQYYFSLPIGELRLHQMALLAALVKGPSYYDPRRHPERALARRNLVLQVMHEQGVITAEAYQQAQQMPLGVVQQKSLLKGAYPAYLDLVKRQLKENYRDEDLRSEGLRIYTSLNPIVQAQAEQALTQTITALEKGYKKLQDLEGSMLVTDPQTGEVLSIIGGRSTRYQGFNRALDALRPIGSLVKPAVYLAALEQGYTLTSELEDEPFQLKQPNGQVWQPQNFDRQAHGKVPLYLALARSYNLSTARLGLDVGLDKVIDLLHRLGVEQPLQPFPSLLLGAQGLALTDVASMYQTIAANGFQIPLRAIRRVTDSSGVELSRYPFALRQTVAADDMYLLQYALQQVVVQGTARALQQSLPLNLNLAGKTGTSNDQRDSWFAGFAGNRLAVVWLGRDDNAPLPFTGSGGALKVWRSFMQQANPQPFSATVPEDVEYLWIDSETGYLSDERCQGATQIPFKRGSRPQYRVDCGQLPQQQNNTPESPGWFYQWFRQE